MREEEGRERGGRGEGEGRERGGRGEGEGRERGGRGRERGGRGRKRGGGRGWVRGEGEEDRGKIKRTVGERKSMLTHF